MNAITTEPSAVTVRPWSVEECTQEGLRDKVCEKFQSVIRDAEDRKNNYQRDYKLLGSGYWYQNDYFRALKEMKQISRLDYFKKNGSFYLGHPPKGFVHVKDDQQPGGKRPCGYTLKQGVVPTEALKSVRQSLCFIDCQEAIQLAYYDTLLEVWGDEVFNRRFGFEGGTPLAFDVDTGRTPLLAFMEQEVFETTDEKFYSSIRKGDELYFRNIPLYSFKHCNGEAMAYHCLCIEAGDEKRFIALGIRKQVNEEQMLEVLADEFNGVPIQYVELYSGQFLAIMNEAKDEACRGVPEHVIAYALEKSITSASIQKAHLLEPQKAGLSPLIHRLDVNKIRAELN